MNHLPAITRLQVDQFRGVIACKLGFRFDDDKLPFLEETLATRLRATHATSVAAYLDQFSLSRTEIGEAARLLTVPETYFLRNRDQFRALEALLRERVRSGTRSLRMLSAGCSTGEEAYSLALTVRETLPDLDQWDITITGCDINPEALEKARSAKYSSWSLREMPDEFQKKYLLPEGRQFLVKENLREMVRFESRNLVEEDREFWRPGAFDIIFCRNVVMYFHQDVFHSMVERLHASLAPKGYLFLGHAENLRGISREFQLCHTHETFYYQKPSGTLEPSPPVFAAAPPREPVPLPTPPDSDHWFDTIDQASNRIERLGKRNRRPSAPSPKALPAPVSRSPEQNKESALDLMKQERFQEALARLADVAEAQGGDVDSLLLRAMLLVSSGDRAGAETVCGQILVLDNLNAGAHYVMGLCREYADDPRGAIEHHQTAVYLDPGFAMPHLHLGLLARRSQDMGTARRELQLAQGLFLREDAARIVLFGGGFGREALMELCRGELNAAGGRL